MDSDHKVRVAKRAERLFAKRMRRIHALTDRFFALLLGLEWIGGIVAAAVVSPRTWAGADSSVHIHMVAAVGLGGLLFVGPLLLVLARPGKRLTRNVIGVAQVGFSALFIHLSGGRIETHFHVFGSLAFLAFYRDWTVLMPATMVVAADHMVRAIFWPESVFGVLVASPWRAVEHAAWVVFEDVFLIWSCVQGFREARTLARQQADLEIHQESVEALAEKRTEQLQQRSTELENSLREIETMSVTLANTRKLEAIGQLAAGIAHEINTPMQYIRDNTEYISESLDAMFALVDHYDKYESQEGPPVEWAVRRAATLKMRDECSFDTLHVELPDAIADTLEGIQRVVGIVCAMKEFSHPGTKEKCEVDLNQSIRSAVTISQNRWKNHATVTYELSDDLPLVRVLPAEMNQVLLNLIVNAGDAIAEKCAETMQSHGQILIRTTSDADWVHVEVEDTGNGIPESIRNRIYDPFFTTKDVGKGTGQGLAICQDIVINKHDGRLDLRTTPGEGTTFIVQLPRVPSDAERAAAGVGSELTAAVPSPACSTA
ncbi:MAG: hypothetical protein CMJ58_07530 [Planctomycetaceae bacterium]|nr:hypothetical protein [Planctomycetaceae bacterium]